MSKNLPTKPPHRSLRIGDSIYFSDASGQAQQGTVSAVGRDGATVDSQDDSGTVTTHSVRHSAVIGHRKRAERKLNIIDRGEDGSIAVDEEGKRVFLRGSIEDDQPEMQKALTGTLETSDDTRIIAVVNSAVAPLLAAMAAMQQQHQQALERFAALVASAIGKPLPAINFQFPEQPAPNIQVDVNVPEQAAPIVNVEPASVTVQVPDRQEVVITGMPERKTESTVERDKEGNLASSVQIESDVK